MGVIVDLGIWCSGNNHNALLIVGVGVNAAGRMPGIKSHPEKLAIRMHNTTYTVALCDQNFIGLPMASQIYTQ